MKLRILVKSWTRQIESLPQYAVHNQAITVTDLVVKRGSAQKTIAECEMGATNIKVIQFYASCLLSSPESALLLVTIQQETAESGNENGYGSSTA